jgi:predicted AAA+ superfamily ATPase
MLPKKSWVCIDEVQKIPELLNIVHSLIEKNKLKFALTGSSARKLKRKGANLLAGRALNYTLFPLTLIEINSNEDLNSNLNWGALPKILDLKSDSLKSKYLRTYVQTYIKEEVVAEQLVRNLKPFRMFLPIAAQMNGKPLNFSNIAKDTGVDYKTIQTYFDILCDTYIGSYLESYSGSVRKVQIQAPKFYFFDLGVLKAISQQLTIPYVPETIQFGDAFETWFINQCFALNSYYDLDFNFSYLRTKDNVEVDLIVTKPDGSQVLVEIKSASHVDERQIKHLKLFTKDFPKAKLICASRINKPMKIDGVEILPYKMALIEIGLLQG